MPSAWPRWTSCSTDCGGPSPTRRSAAWSLPGAAGNSAPGPTWSIFQGIRSAADAVCVSAVFQQAFQAIEDSPKPVTAAMAGHVVGGALELALACHFRLAAEGSRFSMPEVNLGINPGSGGTQRLPRLVGLEAALEMLLGGRPIDAGQALQWGLIDAVCPAAELLQAAADFADAGRPISKTSLRNITAHGDYPDFRPTKMGLPPSADRAANLALLARADGQLAAGRPELIAPRKILEAVRAGIEQSFQAGASASRPRSASAWPAGPRRTRSTCFVPAGTRREFRKSRASRRLASPRPACWGWARWAPGSPRPCWRPG